MMLCLAVAAATWHGGGVGPRLGRRPAARCHPRCDADGIDRPVLLGDLVVCASYGAVQNLVDTALSPLAEASPELFLVEAPLEAPLACAAILGATWLACGLSLGLCSPASTRAGVAPAAYACIATWLASLALVGGSRLLTHAIGVAPPLAAAELNFYMGSLTALGGWRLLCAMLLPPGM